MASSQTSRCASGCALDSADPDKIALVKYRSGDEVMGDESTRTR